MWPSCNNWTLMIKNIKSMFGSNAIQAMTVSIWLTKYGKKTDDHLLTAIFIEFEESDV